MTGTENKARDGYGGNELIPQSLRFDGTTYPDLPYRDRECRQCGRQEPGPVVEKANSDGRHETTRQETDEQTQRLFQMIGIGLVRCAAAF